MAATASPRSARTRAARNLPSGTPQRPCSRTRSGPARSQCRRGASASACSAHPRPNEAAPARSPTGRGYRADVHGSGVGPGRQQGDRALLGPPCGRSRHRAPAATDLREAVAHFRQQQARQPAQQAPRAPAQVFRQERDDIRCHLRHHKVVLGVSARTFRHPRAGRGGGGTYEPRARANARRAPLRHTAPHCATLRHTAPRTTLNSSASRFTGSCLWRERTCAYAPASVPALSLSKVGGGRRGAGAFSLAHSRSFQRHRSYSSHRGARRTPRQRCWPIGCPRRSRERSRRWGSWPAVARPRTGPARSWTRTPPFE